MTTETERNAKLKTYVEFTTLLFDDEEYDFQRNLTTILDAKENCAFSQETINEIVLWKTNRYSPLSAEAMLLINSIPAEKGPHDPALTEKVLRVLLVQPGVRLPMASTILRFKNPYAYQIIDQRAYRFAGFDSDSFKTTKSDKNNERNIKIYLEYLKRLREIAEERNLDFRLIDRIFYAKDKKENPSFPIRY